VNHSVLYFVQARATDSVREELEQNSVRIPVLRRQASKLAPEPAGAAGPPRSTEPGVVRASKHESPARGLAEPAHRDD
jgi:hypothetical protein